jgi:hypothetical protein
MEKINVLKFNDNVKIHYTNKKITLPEEYIKRVESHWESL